MKITGPIKDTKRTIKGYREQGLAIGFVPTMGFLHDGHLSLVRQCLEENDRTVVSVFVNPTQFAPGEDLHEYPRDLERDVKLLEEMGVDLLFVPGAGEIYPTDYATYVEVEGLGKYLCGKSRPTHFRGVTTVVLNLFNIVAPSRAYFGQKDAQQAVIIKRMTKDLNLDIQIRVLPIVRDAGGLALSSRNAYLSAEEREAALALPRALEEARGLVEKGVREAAIIKDRIKKQLQGNPLVEIDYVEVVRLDTLAPLAEIDRQNTLAAAAIRVGKTRLIDNFVLGEM